MNAEQPDMNEMLNAYMDGELETRQAAEFLRLLENSPELKGQLQGLKNARNLLYHLPHEEAPDELSQQVRSMLERKTLFGEGGSEGQASNRFGTLLFQKIRAVAAVLALGAVLSLLVYSIVAPVDSGTDHGLATAMAAQGPMRGKLELVCADMPSVDSFLMRSVQFNDLSSCVTREDLGNERLYYVSCHREDFKQLLSDLSSVWHQFDETVFHVNTGELGNMIRIDSATALQVAGLVNEPDVHMRIKHAKLSMRNNMRNMTDSGRVIASLEDRMPRSGMPSQPRLTSGEPNRPLNSDTLKSVDRVELTIVLR